MSLQHPVAGTSYFCLAINQGVQAQLIKIDKILIEAQKNLAQDEGWSSAKILSMAMS